MTAYINLSGEFAYLSIYLMQWQRVYKFSLLSQVVLFRIITTVQIYLGQDWVFSEISNICHERSWQVQSCAFNSKKQLYTSYYVWGQHMSRMG